MIKRFLRDSTLYTLSTLLTKGVGFVMLPVYVNFLSKEQYGAFDYFNSLIMVLMVLVAFEVSQAIIRFVPDEQYVAEERKRIISTAFWFTLGCYFVFIFAVCFASELISTLLFGDVAYYLAVEIAAVACFSNAMIYLATVIFRAKLEALKSTIISLASVVCVAFSTLVYVYIYSLGLYGALLGLITGQLSISLFVYFTLRKELLRWPSCDHLSEMLRFSVPLVLSSLGVLLAMYSDRLIINYFNGLEDVAVYGAGARFAGVLALFVAGFQSALAPLVYKNYRKSTTAKDIKRLFLAYLFIGLFSIMALVVFGQGVLGFVLGSGYEESFSVLLLLAIAVFLQGSYIFFPGLTISRKTRVLSIINLFSAGLNVVLNFFLVPPYGIIGAAFATAVSAFVYALLNIVFSEKEYPIVTAPCYNA